MQLTSPSPFVATRLTVYVFCLGLQANDFDRHSDHYCHKERAQPRKAEPQKHGLHRRCDHRVKQQTATDVGEASFLDPEAPDATMQAEVFPLRLVGFGNPSGLIFGIRRYCRRKNYTA